ncbi:MAG: lysophospholipid hydrolase, partial [Gammaproteobacteria bacterium]
AELAATATHARLNHILACSPAVLYSFAATGDNRSTFISDNVRKIFGYEPSEYLEEPKFVPDRIHPDDATRIGVDLSRLFKEGHLVNEYRFRHKDGSYRIVSDEIKVIYDDTGKPLEVVGSWTDISKRKQVKENLVSLLKTTSLFASLDEAALRDIAAEANSVQLMGGTQLIKQGDLADSFYLVMGGRIRTFVTKDDGNECQTSEVGRGELVGETAILTGEPQLESARAIRDSNLLQFSKETFYRLVEHHPETVLLLSKNIAIRYQREVRGITANSVVSTIAVIPAGHGAPVSDFVKCLTASLSEIGPTLHLDVECMASALRQGSADDSEEDRLLKWLHEQEAEFQFVIFESTLEPSSWSKQCIRQADRILSVGTAGGDPALNSIEKEIVSQQDNQTIARQELVLLHPNNNELPSGTGRWLDIRKLDDHHHVILSNPLHHKRLCRILTGNAISLVLGGGGARGCAHVGLIRAMQELDVPIDAIGGTSIGSIVASAFALGFSPDEMLAKIDDIAHESKPIKDLTFPIVSLMTGGKLNKSLQKMYGDVQIEDLWVKYYAVSANLTRAQTEVHRRGPVWKSVRASMSIPGQIPPVVFNGELHVDGGVLNNLPVDVMRDVCDGVIIANNVSPRVDMKVGESNETTHSGWYYMLNSLNPFAKKAEMPGIFNTLVRSGMLSSIKAINISSAMADIYMSPPIEKFQLLDFGESHDIEEVGYKYALEVMNDQLRDNELLKSALI